MSSDDDRSERSPQRTGGSRRGFGCGCAGCGTVLTVGLILSLFGAAIGAGGSVRIPWTPANISLAGSVGDKSLYASALPEYVANRVGDNRNFINHSQTLTIGPAEGTELFVVGQQDGAPVVDLRIEVRHR